MRSRKWVVVLLYAGLILLCLGGAGFYIWGIQPERQPGCPYLRLGLRDKCEYDRTFAAENLLINTSFFPVDVEIVISEGPLAHQGVAELAVANIYTTDGQILGGHEIRRWPRASQAANSYQEDGSDTGLPAPPCGIPHNLNYQSPLADQFCAACSVGGHCRAVGQYQDYLSDLEVDSIMAGLTEADFIAILEKIDEQMAQYLDLEE